MLCVCLFFNFQAGAQFIPALKSFFSSAWNCPALWCPKPQVICSVWSSAWYSREFGGGGGVEFIAYLFISWYMRLCLCLMLTGCIQFLMGKAWLYDLFWTKNLRLLAVIWKKNVLFLLPLGLPQESCIWEWPDSQLHTSPVTLNPHFKGRLEREAREDEGNRSHVAVSHLCCALVCREDLHQSSHVLSRVVSSCCHPRSSSPSQGKSCLSGKCLSLSSLWDLVPSEFCEDWGRDS